MDKLAIFVLFGSTGDLAERKIMPAFFKLYQEGRMNQKSTIIAFSRRAWSSFDYHDFIRPALEKVSSSKKTTDEFLSHIVYTQGHFQDQESYHKLRALIELEQEQVGHAQVFYYFSVQPEFYETILKGLSEMRLLKDVQSTILVEKPFGHDVVSAKVLEKKFEEKIQPDQLLRVDHFLAKEGLRNLVTLRKTDASLEATLTYKNIASISVRMTETIGIEGRGEFYERIGALRDVGQNHMLEMLAVILMDISEKNENKARAEAIGSLTIVGEPVLGQYEGYLNETDVSPNSHIETYFKIQAESSLPRWKGVPITLIGGKALAEKKSDVEIYFKDGIKKVFDIQASTNGRDAYEIMLEEAMQGEQTFFASFEEVVASWKFLEPILKNRATLNVKKYSRGTNGPTK